jgi:hypothetical protein
MVCATPLRFNQKHTSSIEDNIDGAGVGRAGAPCALQVYTQDDPSVPETVPTRIDDTALDIS